MTDIRSIMYLDIYRLHGDGGRLCFHRRLLTGAGVPPSTPWWGRPSIGDWSTLLGTGWGYPLSGLDGGYVPIHLHPQTEHAIDRICCGQFASCISHIQSLLERRGGYLIQFLMRGTPIKSYWGRGTFIHSLMRYPPSGTALEYPSYQGLGEGMPPPHRGLDGSLPPQKSKPQTGYAAVSTPLAFHAVGLFLYYKHSLLANWQIWAQVSQWPLSYQALFRRKEQNNIVNKYLCTRRRPCIASRHLMIRQPKVW